MEDGLVDPEKDTIDWMLYVGVKDISVLQALIGMPFLQAHDATDVLALGSIHNLLYHEALHQLRNHPEYLNGIDEGETTLVAAAGTFSRHPDEVGRLLDQGYATVETATTTSSGVQLSIVRTGSQRWDGTMGVLDEAVRFVDQTMSPEFPVGHVVLVQSEKAVSPGAAGGNYGSAISYSPEYEEAHVLKQPHERVFDSWQLRSGLIHEVAHYYWRGNAGWIDEGLANMFEYMHGISVGLTRGQLRTTRDECEMHDLSEYTPELGASQPDCKYYLGRALFQELYDGTTEAEFVQEIAELYLIGSELGIAEVRRVFAVQASVVEKHWSGALNAPENRPFDEGVQRTSHDLIQWDVYPTYDGHKVVLSGTLLIGGRGSEG